jgi:hypothetical protein
MDTIGMIRDRATTTRYWVVVSAVVLLYFP